MKKAEKQNLNYGQALQLTAAQVAAVVKAHRDRNYRDWDHRGEMFFCSLSGPVRGKFRCDFVSLNLAEAERIRPTCRAAIRRHERAEKKAGAK